MYKLKSLYFLLQKKNLKKTNWRTPRAPQTPKHTTNTFFEQTPKKRQSTKKGKFGTRMANIHILRPANIDNDGGREAGWKSNVGISKNKKDSEILVLI